MGEAVLKVPVGGERDQANVANPVSPANPAGSAECDLVGQETRVEYGLASQAARAEYGHVGQANQLNPAECDQAGEQKPLLSIENLSKDFTIHAAGKTIAGCQSVRLAIAPGEFVGITGKSGSGKSTILRCIFRTNLPQEGSIMYESAAFGPVDLAQASARQIVYLRTHEIGYVSQFLNVLPRRTAFEIVMQSALDTYGVDEHDRCLCETEDMLRHFDLAESLWSLYPRSFSGGEKLRLNIAAAMIKQPRLLLLDEPTASLDNASKTKVRALIERLKSQGTTMLGIFHDLEFMEGLCDREYNMQEGRMV